MGLLLFTFFPSILDGLGSIFGLQRGADALVYSSIIFLLYFSLLLLSKSENNSHHLTRLVRELALVQAEKTNSSTQEILLVRVYNEAEVIEKTLTEVLQNIDTKYTKILLINDGSTDNSLEIITTIAERNSNIIVVSHSQNR